MATSKSFTRVRPGIYRSNNKDRRWRIKATARNPHTRKRVAREQVLPASYSLREVVAARAQFAVVLEEDLRRWGAGPGFTRQVNPADVTLRDYAEQWMAKRGPRLKVSTRERYARDIAYHVLPALGDFSVSDLNRQCLEGYVGQMERATKASGAPYAEETLRGWWAVAKTLVRDATTDFGLSDPTQRIRPPSGKVRGVRETETLTEAELTAFLRVVKTAFPAWYTEVFTIAGTGMRPGELYELRWKDMDLSSRTIRLERAHVRGHVGSTKTNDPRQVPIAESLAEALALHRRARFSASGKIPGANDLVFPGAHGGHRFPQSLRKPLAQASEIAGLDLHVTAQVIRRTVNTLLLEAGVNEIIIRSILGHASRQMTSRYAGIHHAQKLAAVERIEALSACAGKGSGKG